jgi:peptidyl-prolyl cis-trans isomerase A (cyclophilin A)
MKFILMFSLIMSVNSFAKDKMIKVLMQTNMGDVEIELNETLAPITVKNFLGYVDKKYFDGLVFHRVIKDFMLQGGGFDAQMKQKSTGTAIKNEAKNGLKNEVGTIAMARTQVVDSATSQFFINMKNNTFLNHKSPANFGYAVFGSVTKGMPILKKIENVKTKAMGGGHQNVPVKPVVIKTIKRM